MFQVNTSMTFQSEMNQQYEPQMAFLPNTSQQQTVQSNEKDSTHESYIDVINIIANRRFMKDTFNVDCSSTH